MTRAILEALRAGAGAAEAVARDTSGDSRPDRSFGDSSTDSSADPFGLDLDFRARVTPIFRLLHDRYWRIEVIGARNVPRQGPVILIANHSGALPFDGAMICTSLDRKPGVVVRYLYDRFVRDVPAVDGFYRRTGGLVATRENAATALQRDAHLLIFPEGVPGVAKSFDERYKLRSFSPGFARLAMAYDVPVVPIAVVGAEEIYPVVGRAEGLGEAFGVPYLPLTPFFPLFGILGAIPLPTKWLMRVGKPMYLGRSDDEEKAKQVTLVVRRKLQAMVTRLKQRRRSIFLG